MKTACELGARRRKAIVYAMHTHKSGVLAPLTCPFPGRSTPLHSADDANPLLPPPRNERPRILDDARDWPSGHLSVIARDTAAAGAHADRGRASRRINTSTPVRTLSGLQSGGKHPQLFTSACCPVLAASRLSENTRFIIDCKASPAENALSTILSVGVHCDLVRNCPE